MDAFMNKEQELKQANELLDEAKKFCTFVHDSWTFTGIHDEIEFNDPDYILTKEQELFDKIRNRPRATEDEGTGENDILSYLHHDINTLPTEDVCALYSYMRRHMIAKIPGLEDPLAHFRTKPRLTPPKDDTVHRYRTPWISVEDRLPETSCDALASWVCGDGIPVVREVRFISGQWIYGLYNNRAPATHWMPLPAPPAEWRPEEGETNGND